MRRLRWMRIFGSILLTVGVFAADVARAEDQKQETRYLGDRGGIRLNGGIVQLNTQVAAGRGLGALIDLEDILGFDEEISTLGFEGFYRFTANHRHAIRFRYGNFSRDAFDRVDGTVPILDLEFTGEIESSFVNEIGQVEYQYSFVNNGKTEAGISAGLAVYKYDLTLSGQVTIGGDPDQSNFRSERVDVLAPVPGVGFFVNQALGKDVILEIETSAIDLEFGEHNGRIFQTWASLTWFFSRHVGVGFGISGSDVVYERQGSEKIKVDIRQSSVNLNLTFVF